MATDQFIRLGDRVTVDVDAPKIVQVEYSRSNHWTTLICIQWTGKKLAVDRLNPKGAPFLSTYPVEIFSPLTGTVGGDPFELLHLDTLKQLLSGASLEVLVNATEGRRENRYVMEVSNDMFIAHEAKVSDGGVKSIIVLPGSTPATQAPSDMKMGRFLIRPRSNFTDLEKKAKGDALDELRRTVADSTVAKLKGDYYKKADADLNKKLGSNVPA